MTREMPVIQAATVLDRAQLVSVLVEAFQSDPLAVWLYPDPNDRRRNHGALFNHTLADPGREALVDMPQTRDAVAIWRPVDSAMDPPAPPGASVAAVGLFARIAEAAPAPPYWNLAFIGARERGGGRGSALMTHRLARLSGQVALWTANSANLTFYRRFGFEICTDLNDLGTRAWWLTLALSPEPMSGNSRSERTHTTPCI